MEVRQNSLAGGDCIVISHCVNSCETVLMNFTVEQLIGCRKSALLAASWMVCFRL